MCADQRPVGKPWDVRKKRHVGDPVFLAPFSGDACSPEWRWRGGDGAREKSEEGGGLETVGVGGRGALGSSGFWAGVGGSWAPLAADSGSQGLVGVVETAGLGRGPGWGAGVVRGPRWASEPQHFKGCGGAALTEPRGQGQPESSRCLHARAQPCLSVQPCLREMRLRRAGQLFPA